MLPQISVLSLKLFYHLLQICLLTHSGLGKLEILAVRKRSRLRGDVPKCVGEMRTGVPSVGTLLALAARRDNGALEQPLVGLVSTLVLCVRLVIPPRHLCKLLIALCERVTRSGLLDL